MTATTDIANGKEAVTGKTAQVGEKLTAPKKVYSKSELKEQEKAKDKIKKAAKAFAKVVNSQMILATPDAHVGIVQVGKKVMVGKTLSAGGTFSAYSIEVYKEKIEKKTQS